MPEIRKEDDPIRYAYIEMKHGVIREMNLNPNSLSRFTLEALIEWDLVRLQLNPSAKWSSAQIALNNKIPEDWRERYGRAYRI